MEARCADLGGCAEANNPRLIVVEAALDEVAFPLRLFLYAVITEVVVPIRFLSAFGDRLRGVASHAA
jgi:hypothetical protein